MFCFNYLKIFKAESVLLSSNDVEVLLKEYM